MSCDEYAEFYILDSWDEWANAGYDENGEAAVCDICGGEIQWNGEENLWQCLECGQIFDRVVWFNHIGADPPSSECITNCRENYPFCKKHCSRFPIRPDDPMRT